MQATVEELNRGIERHRKTIDKANNLIMEQELAPIKKIYVDLNMLADTRLGCLLMLADGDAETVEYLRQGLEHYNRRYSRETCKYYPKYKYRPDVVRSIYSNPEYAEAIFNFSPATDIGWGFADLLNQHHSINQSLGHLAPIHVVLNCFPLAPVPVIVGDRGYAKRIEANVCDHGARVEVLSVDPRGFAANFWQSCDMIFLDSLSYLAEANTPFRHALFEEEGYLAHNQIFAAAEISDSMLKTWDKEDPHWRENDPSRVATALDDTQKILWLATKFLYINVNIPILDETKQS